MRRGRGPRKTDLASRPSSKPAPNAGPYRISRTESFARDFKNLPKEIQQRAERAIGLLVANPSHPSLRTKKMHGLKDTWEASVTMSYRITFQRAGGTIILHRIGTHDMLQRERG